MSGSEDLAVGDGEIALLLEQTRSVSGEGMSCARRALADFIALLLSRGIDGEDRPSLLDGTAFSAAFAASASSAHDLDDVDWAGPHHPGSVIWSAVMAVAARQEVPGDRVIVAGALGYQVAAQAAALLGIEHARLWHLTATCGAIGAAAGVARLAGLSDDAVARSLVFAILSAGGLGQAPLERRGAARVTRAAAAAQGVVAAGMSDTTVATVRYPWSGPRGALQVLRARETRDSTLVDPWLSLGLRNFPVNGFVQAAVAATAAIAPEDAAEVTEVVWGLPAGAVALVCDDDHGDWWNGRLAAARAIGTRSPFMVGKSGPWDALTNQVRIEPIDTPIGSAHVTVNSHGAIASIDAPRITFATDSSLYEHWRAKCKFVLGVDADFVEELVKVIESPSPDWQEVRRLLIL